MKSYIQEGDKIEILTEKIFKMTRKFYKEDIEGCIKFEETHPLPSKDGHAFTEITDPIEIKQLYKKKYNSRIVDGHKYVIDFTADRYIDVITNVHTIEEVFVLENHIKDLYVELNNGWWLTAQNTNINLPLMGIYDQIMKDSIQAALDTYISENY